MAGTDEFIEAGTFETRLSMEVVSELNTRKIIHRLKEIDNHRTVLSTLPAFVNEAAEVLAEIKHKHRRIRL